MAQHYYQLTRTWLHAHIWSYFDLLLTQLIRNTTCNRHHLLNCKTTAEEFKTFVKGAVLRKTLSWISVTNFHVTPPPYLTKIMTWKNIPRIFFHLRGKILTAFLVDSEILLRQIVCWLQKFQKFSFLLHFSNKSFLFQTS